jgi:two-component system, OmpR family, response regulator
MTWPTAHFGASLGAIRWPCRVIAVGSPSRILTPCGHDRLLASGIDLRPYPDGASALLNLMVEHPGAVLAPTDLIGVNFLRFIRTIVGRSDIPVIIGLTGDDSHQRAFHGLEAGARGLISLPADPDQLASAVRRLGLARTESAASLQYGPISLDPLAHQVRVSGSVVRLSLREFALVEYLLAEAPRVVSIAEIAAVIGYDEQVDGLVRARKYVEKLRRKFGEAAAGEPTVLETVRGLGYRLIDS